MSDDIVTRLREHANGDYEKTADFMLGLAADEIERLRAENAIIKSVLWEKGTTGVEVVETSEMYETKWVSFHD